jgi:hypothetical protein
MYASERLPGSPYFAPASEMGDAGDLSAPALLLYPGLFSAPEARAVTEDAIQRPSGCRDPGHQLGSVFSEAQDDSDQTAGGKIGRR